MRAYSHVESIGSGSFGRVYLVRHKQEGGLYVLKRIKIAGLGEKDRGNIENEVQLMKQLSHPNIVGYKESFTSRDYINIVMSYCEGGDLHNKVQKFKGNCFPENVSQQKKLNF